MENFNDLLFYVSANPWSGIDPDDVPPVGGGCADTDLDGVDDCNDDFPNDPERTTLNTYVGSLAYEDLWPSRGDYDYNDMVVDYDIDHILNAFHDRPHIFNLGHGITPPTPVENVQKMIDYIRNR